MEAADGQDLTPKGAKNQALVAILALSPKMRRSRRWLEDKLWSTFGSEQASANLRQALSKLRGTLGPCREVLHADRSSVWLDLDAIDVDLLDEVVPEDDRAELLQGIDVRDPEFEEWLRMERAELKKRVELSSPGDAKGILIHCSSDLVEPGKASALGDILSNQIGENIGEQVRAWRQANGLSEEMAALPQSDVGVVTQVIDNARGHSVFLKIVHQPSARVLYSKLLHLDRLDAILEGDESVGRMIFEAADHVIGKLPLVLENARPEARATALSRLALYRMFSFEKDSLRESFKLMEQAFSHDENGVYLAWSSLIRMVQLMEVSEIEQDAVLEEAVDLQYRAMHLAADNPLVHALVSKVRATALGESAGVIDYARTAVERNPASAYGWKSLADAYLVAGELEKAIATSARACRLAAGSPFKHWWDTGHCIIAIACNRPAEAIEAGEAAARAAPMSRPAQRHLLALYALEGQFDKARAVADKLARIEPGFSLDRIINDESYPVRTLRNQGLLEPLKALI